MSEFDNVTVVKKANIYFDGGVTSRTIRFASGEVKTLGIMLPGDYQFNTDSKEIMEIQSGEVEVLLADETEWKTYGAGQSFQVKASSSFKVRANMVTDYCCSFVD